MMFPVAFGDVFNQMTMMMLTTKSTMLDLSQTERMEQPAVRFLYMRMYVACWMPQGVLYTSNNKNVLFDVPGCAQALYCEQLHALQMVFNPLLMTFGTKNLSPWEAVSAAGPNMPGPVCGENIVSCLADQTEFQNIFKAAPGKNKQFSGSDLAITSFLEKSFFTLTATAQKSFTHRKH